MTASNDLNHRYECAAKFHHGSINDPKANLGYSKELPFDKSGRSWVLMLPVIGIVAPSGTKSSGRITASGSSSIILMPIDIC